MKSRPVAKIFEVIGLAVCITLSAVLLYFMTQRFYWSAYPIAYQDTVLQQSALNHVSPALVFAVIRTESGFDPYAQSSIPARGLMQITEDTFEWIKFKRGYDQDSGYAILFDGNVNIRYGTALLAILLEEFETEQNILCAYHAGRRKAIEWINNPAYAPDGKNIENIPYGDTGRYVEKVLKTKQVYEVLYNLQ